MQEETGWDWYFSKRLRSLFTIPIMVIVGINVFYNFVNLLLMEIDLLIGNFILWLFFGEMVVAFLGGLAITVSFLPLAFLPGLWHSNKVWGIAKIGIFILMVVASVIFASLLSFGALWFVDKFAVLRTSLWWAELWGVASSA